MADAFSPKQYGIIYVHICLSSIPKSLARVKYERYIYALLLLALAEFEKRLNIVYEWH